MLDENIQPGGLMKTSSILCFCSGVLISLISFRLIAGETNSAAPAREASQAETNILSKSENHGVSFDSVVVGDFVSIGLKSGDTMQGKVASASGDKIQVEVANSDRTIFSTKTIQKSEIKSIQPVTSQEYADFEKLTKYRLNPNQAYRTDYYASVIALFEKFLSTYPSSIFAPQVHQFVAAWKEEQTHAEAGHVKYLGQWYTPEDAQSAYQQDMAEAGKKEKISSTSPKPKSASIMCEITRVNVMARTLDVKVEGKTVRLSVDKGCMIRGREANHEIPLSDIKPGEKWGCIYVEQADGSKLVRRMIQGREREKRLP